MKLVFIDLEACNAIVRASVCNIGIVVTDQNFNILETKNIYLNPEIKYTLPKSFDIGVKKEFIFQQPNFLYHYPTLKQYLNQDHIIIGHAMAGDAKRLHAMCQKYKLKKFNFPFICTQVAYAAFSNNFNNFISLQNFALEFGYHFTPHRALDDAMATMEGLKALLKTQNLTLPEFINKYQITYGKSCKKTVIPCSSYYLQALNIDYHLSKNKSPVINNKVRQILIDSYNSFNININIAEEEKIFSNCIITFNKELEKSSNIRELLFLIIILGGHYSNSISDSNFYVRRNDKKYDYRLRKINKKTTIITEDSFLELLDKYKKIIDEVFNKTLAVI